MFKPPNLQNSQSPSSESNLSIEIKSLDLKLLSLLGDLEIQRLGGVVGGIVIIACIILHCPP